MQQLPDAYLIGFTATPDYKVAKHLPLLYKDIVIGPQPQELVELGYLSPYYHYERKSANLSNLQQKNGEFTEESQFAAFNKPTVFAGLHEDLNKHTYKKAIIFCSSISHCTALTEELRGQGYICAEVHSNNPQSNGELATFMYGQTPICVSVGILTKGFDFPEIDLVILQRATTSLALYCQMVGRGSRVTPTKTKFTVLDYGGNASRHGLWNFEHDWAEKWRKAPKRKKDGIAPVKECPKCFLIVAPSLKICPECGHVFAPTKKELEEGEMVNVTAEYDKIRGKRIADLTPNELALYAKFTNKKPFAARVAKAKGKQYCTQYADAMSYSPYWADRHDYSTTIDFYNALIK
jgi:superfamily II DNA or RNA helicase